jgi:hypothetical protein
MPNDEEEEVENIRSVARGVDWKDPTKNVRELVLAESKYQDAMRDQLEKQIIYRVNDLINLIKMGQEGVIAFQNAMRDAETRRIDQLAANRQEFQNTIRDMLAESVRTTSTLVSTQLVQIQATFDTRVSKLEAYQFTQAGARAVSDPALEQSLRSLGAGMREMQGSFAESLNKIAQLKTTEEKSTSKTEGQGQMIAWIVAAVSFAASVAVVIATLTGKPAQTQQSAQNDLTLGREVQDLGRMMKRLEERVK